MPLAEIVGVVSLVKTTLDIGRSFLSGSKFDEASSKDTVNKMYDALMAAKFQINDALDTIHDRDKRIAELEAQLEMRKKVIRYRDAVYFSNDQGKPTGKPFCLPCWDSKAKLHSLTLTGNVEFVECHICKAGRYIQNAPFFTPPEQ